MIFPALLVVAVSLPGVGELSMMTACAGEPVDADSPAVSGRDGADVDADQGLSVEIARDRAIVMLDVYSVTLEVLHHQYFHGDRAVVPARAMQDIFSTIKRQSKVDARWISVNMKPMSISHEPTSDFEKRAAKEIAAGKDHVEVIEDGFYRRATPIPLRNGCVGCHGGLFEAASKKPKFAGLVISMPIRQSTSDDSKN